MKRVAVVNGVDVSARPVCADDQHAFAAHHGYCVVCGLDGWSSTYRREVESAQARVKGRR
jgi:hypothetical protein